MVLHHNITLGWDTMVMVWIDSNNVRNVLDKGFRLIHAASDFFYLGEACRLHIFSTPSTNVDQCSQDCGGGGWLGNSIRNSWCDPFKTWQKIYSFDPYANVPDVQKSLVLGGESAMERAGRSYEP